MSLLKNSPVVTGYLRRRYDFLRSAPLRVRLRWADETELVGMIDIGPDRYFLGGLERDAQHAEPGDYRALSADECAGIHSYRAFRLFQPWPQPVLAVGGGAGGLKVVDSESEVMVTLREIGSCQAWWGERAGVIWEVLLSRDPFADDATFRLAYQAVWGQVEAHLAGLGVNAVATEHQDPEFDVPWYQAVLREMGYRQVEGGAFRKEPLR
jgi:hypothetical protein